MCKRSFDQALGSSDEHNFAIQKLEDAVELCEFLDFPPSPDFGTHAQQETVQQAETDTVPPATVPSGDDSATTAVNLAEGDTDTAAITTPEVDGSRVTTAEVAQGVGISKPKPKRKAKKPRIWKTREEEEKDELAKKAKKQAKEAKEQDEEAKYNADIGKGKVLKDYSKQYIVTMTKKYIDTMSKEQKDKMKAAKEEHDKKQQQLYQEGKIMTKEKFAEKNYLTRAPQACDGCKIHKSKCETRNFKVRTGKACTNCVHAEAYCTETNWVTEVTHYRGPTPEDQSQKKMEKNEFELKQETINGLNERIMVLNREIKTWKSWALRALSNGRLETLPGKIIKSLRDDFGSCMSNNESRATSERSLGPNKGNRNPGRVDPQYQHPRAHPDIAAQAAIQQDAITATLKKIPGAPATNLSRTVSQNSSGSVATHGYQSQHTAAQIPESQYIDPQATSPPSRGSQQASMYHPGKASHYHQTPHMGFQLDGLPGFDPQVGSYSLPQSMEYRPYPDQQYAPMTVFELQPCGGQDACYPPQEHQTQLPHQVDTGFDSSTPKGSPVYTPQASEGDPEDYVG